MKKYLELDSQGYVVKSYDFPQPDTIEVEVSDKHIKTKTKEELILEEFKAKEKIKALTTSERLDRLERLMGIK